MSQSKNSFTAFFFGASSPHQLAVLRIVFSLLTLVSLYLLSAEASFHFSDQGWLPREAPAWALQQPLKWTPLFWSGTPLFVHWYFIVASFFAVMMLLGLATPIVIPICWICIMGIRSRNMILTDGTEYILQIVLMYLSFADCGRVYSLDQKWNLRKWLPFSPAQSMWPLRMIQIHICMVYLIAGASKLLATQWWDGEVISLILTSKNYARWDFSLLQQSSVAFALTKAMTWMTVLWEISFAFLMLWKKGRRWVLAFGLCFHAGIFLFLKISLFAPVMMAAYLAFIPPHYFSSLLETYRSFRAKGRAADPNLV